MKQRHWMFWPLLMFAGAISGLATSAAVIKGRDTQVVAVGPWQANVLAGSGDADALTRARVAVGGLLALDRSETLYYIARQDSQGQGLRSDCEYRISGKPPQARWWSITAYAEDHFLMSGAQGLYSVNGSQAIIDPQGLVQIRTGPQARAKDGVLNMLLTPAKPSFLLTLRLYNPAASLQQNPSALDELRIERVGACS